LLTGTFFWGYCCLHSELEAGVFLAYSLFIRILKLQVIAFG